MKNLRKGEPLVFKIADMKNRYYINDYIIPCNILCTTQQKY